MMRCLAGRIGWSSPETPGRLYGLIAANYVDDRNGREVMTGARVYVSNPRPGFPCSSLSHDGNPVSLLFSSISVGFVSNVAW